MAYGKFWFADWLSSPTIYKMTLPQEAAYFRMLCFEFQEGGYLPTEKRDILSMLRRETTIEDVERVLELKFKLDPERGWYNEKLLETYSDAMDFSNKQSERRRGKVSYPEATTPTGRPAPPPQAPIPDVCAICNIPMFSKMDRTGEAYSKCQNRACAQKGIWLYADGHTWNPQTKETGNAVDGKSVVAKKAMRL